MNPFKLLRRAAHFALTGRPGLPAAFDFPLTSPQRSVSVLLHGLGEPRDITNNHSVACPIPFTLCIGLEDGCEVYPSPRNLSVRFVERTDSRRLLGEIKLRHQQVVIANGSQLHLFRATGCRNYSFSPFRDWTRSLYARWVQKKSLKTGKLAVSPLDSCCNEVVFSCPRPIVLACLRQGNRGNIFPMNLMGQVAKDTFAFALNRNNLASQNVMAVRELTVCTVPFSEAEQVRQLGRNHYSELVEWSSFTFSTRSLSPQLNIPIPDFALTSTELKVEKELCLGSHIFFAARIVGKHVYKSAPEFYRIHGTYAAQALGSLLPSSADFNQPTRQRFREVRPGH